jgi:hypothetical protein
MQQFKFLLSLTLAATMVACNQYSVSTSSGSGYSSTISGSTSTSPDKKEVTLSGTSGMAELAGDKIQVKDGTVFVNGASFGSVPAGAEVKYTMTAEGRALYVGGQRRNALQ